MPWPAVTAKPPIQSASGEMKSARHILARGAALLDLLAQEIERETPCCACPSRQHDVVGRRAGTAKAHDAFGGQPTSPDDVIQHLACIGRRAFWRFRPPPCPRGWRDSCRPAPRRGKRRPVDALDQLVQGILGEDARSGDGGLGRRVGDQSILNRWRAPRRADTFSLVPRVSMRIASYWGHLDRYPWLCISFK